MEGVGGLSRTQLAAGWFVCFSVNNIISVIKYAAINEPTGCGHSGHFSNSSHPPLPFSKHILFSVHVSACAWGHTHMVVLMWGSVLSFHMGPTMELRSTEVGRRCPHPVSLSVPQADARPACPSLLPHAGRESAVFRASHLLRGQGDPCSARCTPLGSPWLPQSARETGDRLGGVS